MSKKILGSISLMVFLCLGFWACKKEISGSTTGDVQQNQMLQKKASPSGTASLFATGFNDPRGLKFGPDGELYVAEAGIGGTISSAGFACAQAPPPFGPYFGSPTGGRISRVNSNGIRTTVTDQLPTALSSADDHMGPADVAFLNGDLYVLQNAGCSRGLPNLPSGVYKVSNGSPTLVGNLSAFQAAHPVANPEPHDFEPDGAWYSLVAVGSALYALDANHGELVKVQLNGTVSRVVDISAVLGHVVPTSMDHRGNFYVGNLGTFPIMGNSTVQKINPDGKVHQVAEGLSAILGIVVDQQSWIYVLEMTTGAPFPTPGTGRITAISPSGSKSTLVSGLNFPTGMTMGPDGNLYVSSWGFGMPPGGGQITKITLQ